MSACLRHMVLIMVDVIRTPHSFAILLHYWARNVWVVLRVSAA